MKLVEHINPEKFMAFFIFPFGYKSGLTLEMMKENFGTNQNWTEQKFSIEGGINYNEYQYFYPHLRNLLFPTSDKKVSSVFYEYKLTSDASYQVINQTVPFSLKLPLKNIFLHFFDNSTGILSFQISQQNTSPSLQDYLYFLDMGRRIYPAFINPKAEIIDESELENAFKENDAIHFKQCPSQIIIYLNSEKKFITDFTEFKICKTENNSLGIASIIIDLLDSNDLKYESGDYWPLVDDRMFTHTFYMFSEKTKNKDNSSFIKELSAYFDKLPTKLKLSDASKIWYQMIFLDSDNPTCANDYLFHKALNESTYTRWSNWGGFYGFSRYSSAFINRKDYVLDHFSSMYYRIALLVFFYRGSLISFSEKAKRISELISDPKSEKEAHHELQQLNENFLLFENKYLCREVSAQEQGIEIYDLWSSKMRHQELLQDIREKIKGLFTYFEFKHEKRIKKILDFVTIFGAFWAIITAALAIAALPEMCGVEYLWIFPGNLTQIDLFNIAWFFSIISILILSLTLWLLVYRKRK